MSASGKVQSDFLLPVLDSSNLGSLPLVRSTAQFGPVPFVSDFLHLGFLTLLQALSYPGLSSSVSGTV